MNKICNKCNIEKPVTDFYKQKMRNDNYWVYSSCKQCDALYTRNNYWKNRKVYRPKVKDLEGEVWYAIPNHKNYKISNLFRIKSIDRMVNTKRGVVHYQSKIIGTYIGNNGYVYVNTTPTDTIHTIIAKVFIPNPENKPEVNHKNGNRADFRIENLEWNTTKENADHKYEVLGYKHPSGENNKLSKLIIMIHPDGKEERIKGVGNAARRLGSPHTATVSDVLTGKKNDFKGYKFKYA